MGNISYERPPLVEVSFGVRFAPLAGLRSAHYGQYWQRLRPDFVNTFDKPPVGIPSAPSAAFGQAEWFPLPRVWFEHRDQEQLIQLQPDGFFFNWRRLKPQTEYPRFSKLEPMFQKQLSKFLAFLSEESLGLLIVQGYELTYVNHIYEGEGWSSVTDIGSVFPDLGWRVLDRPQGQPQGVAWHSNFECRNVKLDADVKFGKARGEGERKLFAFELKATGVAAGSSLDNLSPWLIEANSVIVAAFGNLTSGNLQWELWKRVGS
jgi:uncharacterized protein (TIGR04255 family)